MPLKTGYCEGFSKRDKDSLYDEIEVIHGEVRRWYTVRDELRKSIGFGGLYFFGGLTGLCVDMQIGFITDYSSYPMVTPTVIIGAVALHTYLRSSEKVKRVKKEINAIDKKIEERDKEMEKLRKKIFESN